MVIRGGSNAGLGDEAKWELTLHLGNESHVRQTHYHRHRTARLTRFTEALI